jgi:hypothetical protein
VFGTLAFGRVQWYVSQPAAARGVAHDPVGVVGPVQVPVERAFGIKHHIRTVIALAETGIAEQVDGLLVL